MKRRSFLLLFCFFSINTTFFSDGFAATILLVPGTGNRWLSGYFSKDIIRLLEEKHTVLQTFDRLEPLAGYQRNGELLATVLQAHCSNPHLWIVSHSAGTLYALVALKESECPVRGVISIGAPLLGAPLAKAVYATWWGSWFRGFLPRLWIRTDIFEDYLPDRMPEFYRSIQPQPHRFRFFTYAGKQPTPHTFGEYWDAEYIGPALSWTSRFLEGAHDGAVDVESAYGKGLTLGVKGGGRIVPEPQLPVLELDHQEQFQPTRFLNFLHKHRLEVERRQHALYESVALKISSEEIN